MKTSVSIDGTRFLINDVPTYRGVTHYGRSIEGLLFNSRMIQAIFDDACEDTRSRWRYPDTGVWDPERNTDEFCAQLPAYHAHGLRAVTVGLQGGGSNYSPEVYDRYRCSGYTADGEFVPAFFERLLRVLRAADDAGMVVIVNFFYWKQVAYIPDDAVLLTIAERVADWLLQTGYRNILVDVANEAANWWQRPLCSPDQVHRLLDAVQQTTRDGRRLLAGISSGGGQSLPGERWMAMEDFSLPHGNGCSPDALRAKLRRLKEMEGYRRRPRPLLINEDSIFVANMEAAIEEYASWGFYCQGYGSDYHDRMDWREHGRENDYAALSGFQTLPVNWAINTPEKRAFFAALQAITSGACA